METVDLIAKDGFALVKQAYSGATCKAMLACLVIAMREDEENFHVRQSRGIVFAARNLFDICPEVKQFWRQPILMDLLSKILGDQYGLVRVLYFDKPSDRSWSLPFHKDMTIAVKDNSLPTTHFCKPTRKAGVDHVEASTEILQRMLTLRIHLDKVTNENGPLQVIPGSHATGKEAAAADLPPVKVMCEAGDVLAMRPLISHGSAHSDPGKGLHRRILHLEFSADEQLPDGFEWAAFARNV